MPRLARRLVIVVAVAAAGFAAVVVAQTPPAQTPPPLPPLRADRPHLIVMVVIDQFRADYVDMYGARWTKGLRRLLDKGAVFTKAAYPYAATYTCAGHATIGTGAFPAVHGMSGNTFYDRALRRTVPCAFDADVTPVAFAGGTGRERHSARSLLVPTFADELRRQSPPASPPHVVALGAKPRTAITLGGRGGAGSVTVWEEDDGTWASSDAFTRTPWPDVDEYVKAHPMKAAYGQAWTLLWPPSAYQFSDDGAGEARPAPWGKTFPHVLNSPSGNPDNTFVGAWEKSPLNDEFLLGLALHLLKSRRLGLSASTDYLALSMPVLDLSGHEYGPRSFEVQDVLARIDINLGVLLDAIEQQVGRDYVLGLSSDHGVALLPEQNVAAGRDAGRVSTTEVRNAVNAAVERVLGAPPPHVASVYEHQVALNPGVVDQLRRKSGGLKAITNALLGVKGIRAAYSSEDLAVLKTTDPGIRAWQLSYVPGRSGDFMITPKPDWVTQSVAGTTHGTMNEYDQRVPFILYGDRFRTGRYTTPVTPADFAPTFAALVGIKLARAQGHALLDVVVR